MMQDSLDILVKHLRGLEAEGTIKLKIIAAPDVYMKRYFIEISTKPREVNVALPDRRGSPLLAQA